MEFKYGPAAQGFDEYFWGVMQSYRANYDLQGRDLGGDSRVVNKDGFRIDVQTDAALAFIRRNHARPFFLYVAYFAPHVPLQASKEYLDRFPGPMPERRRYALAMLSAVDDGIGKISQELQKWRIEENTLIMYTSDNGAPLNLTREDRLPVNISSADWDGSLNDPWVGEKGMLTEGGIRVPFLAKWKGVIPAGTVYSQPVSSLDIAATAVRCTGAAWDNGLDGVDLVPYLAGKRDGAPHEALFWRFWDQAAVREGQWKYLRVGKSGEFLFDLSTDQNERVSLLGQHPEIVQRLARRLDDWTAGLQPPGSPTKQPNDQEKKWYKHYLGFVPAPEKP